MIIKIDIFYLCSFIFSFLQISPHTCLEKHASLMIGNNCDSVFLYLAEYSSLLHVMNQFENGF